MQHNEFSVCTPAGAKPGSKFTVKVVAVGADGQKAEDTRELKVCEEVPKRIKHVYLDPSPAFSDEYVVREDKMLVRKADLESNKESAIRYSSCMPEEIFRGSTVYGAWVCDEYGYCRFVHADEFTSVGTVRHRAT